jgi:hypothetical protein
VSGVPASLPEKKRVVKETRPRTKPLDPARASATRTVQKPPAPEIGRPPRALSDPRLPKIGTQLVRTIKSKKLECLVEEGGFRFQGKVYASLSGAASAAAREAGVFPSQNGFVFWRITRSTKSPLQSLERKWERYDQLLERALAARAGEGARRIAEVHLQRLLGVLRKAASGDSK